MSSITTDKGILHYEVTGRGKPVIFLHGWLGSWQLWKKTMMTLSGDFRTYALDFWGFGESEKKLDSYHVLDFADLIYQFMNQMGIEQAPLIGHSMGGTVSIIFGLSHADRVSKICIIGSPINGSSLAIPLKLAGRKPIATLLYSNIQLFRAMMRFAAPIICVDPNFPSMMDQDITKTNLYSFLNSIASLRKTNLTGNLKNLNVPILGMYGINDNIVSPNQMHLLKRELLNAEIESFRSSGHFIMLDEPEAFSSSIIRFLTLK